MTFLYGVAAIALVGLLIVTTIVALGCGFLALEWIDERVRGWW